MNAIKSSLCFALLTQSFLHAQKAPQEPVESFASLLAKIPRQEEIAKFKEIVFMKRSILPLKRLTEPPPGKEREFNEASKAMDNVIYAIPKIRKLIKPGKSIFDYPGLLSRGRITYNDGSNKPYYTQYFGAYLRSTEGSGSYDFEIIFNCDGLITEVKSVVYKL